MSELANVGLAVARGVRFPPRVDAFLRTADETFEHAAGRLYVFRDMAARDEEFLILFSFLLDDSGLESRVRLVTACYDCPALGDTMNWGEWEDPWSIAPCVRVSLDFYATPGTTGSRRLYGAPTGRRDR